MSREARINFMPSNSKPFGDNTSPNKRKSTEFIYKNCKDSQEEVNSSYFPQKFDEILEENRANRPRSMTSMQTSQTKEFFKSMYDNLDRECLRDERDVKVNNFRLVQSQANLCNDDNRVPNSKSTRPSVAPPPLPSTRRLPPPLPARNTSTKLSTSNIVEDYRKEEQSMQSQLVQPMAKRSRNSYSESCQGTNDYSENPLPKIVAFKLAPNKATSGAANKTPSVPQVPYIFPSNQSPISQPVKVAHHIAPYVIDSSTINGVDPARTNGTDLSRTNYQIPVNETNLKNYSGKRDDNAQRYCQNSASITPRNKYPKTIRFQDPPNDQITHQSSTRNTNIVGAKSLFNLHTIEEAPGTEYEVNNYQRNKADENSWISRPKRQQHMSSAHSMGDLLGDRTKASYKASQL